MRTPHMVLLLGAALVWAASHAHAAGPEAKLAYQQARDAAGTEYKNARARCNAITGNPKKLCVAETKAANVHAEETARARYEDTLKAYTRARVRIASANYDRDQVRCAGMTGNEKDVCKAQAKAVLVAAEADARADQKSIEARNEARDDKMGAAYRVEMEKCDAYAGAAKDQCVTAAKTAFNK
jgi:hypothetical protein